MKGIYRHFFDWICPSLVLTCVVFSPGFLIPQEIEFEHIPNELGLSQNFIPALCQDHSGFLWVASKDGLNRFDGYAFKTFTNDPYDTTSLSDNYIHSLFEDSQRRLWVGTEKGLNLFDPGTESFIRVKASFLDKKSKTLQEMTITCITEDRAGNIWLGTQQHGVIKVEFTSSDQSFGTANYYQFESETVYQDLHASNGVFNLIATASGAIWAGFYRHVQIIEWDSLSGRHQNTRLDWSMVLKEQWIPKMMKDYPHSEKKDRNFAGFPFSIFSGKDQSIWIHTLDGFGKWNATQKRFDFQPLDFDRSDYFNSPLLGVNRINLEDHQGRLWVVGDWITVIYNPGTHQLETQYSSLDHASDLKLTGGIKCLLQDQSGAIWAGTSGHGLYKYAPIKSRFRQKNRNAGGFSRSVRSLYQTSDGTIWIADTGLKLHQWKRDQGIPPQNVFFDRGKYQLPSIEYAGIFYSMLEDHQGNLWLGGGSSYLYHIFLEKGEMIDFELFKIKNTEEEIFDIYEDKNGVLWLITNTEFGRFDPQTGIFNGKTYLENSTPGSNQNGTPVIHQGSDGIFWLGTKDGLKKYDASKDTFITFRNNLQDRNSLSNDMVKTICPDPQNPDQVLWLGTGGGGLNRFDINTQTFTHFDKEDGLPDNVIYGILSDEQGSLWMSTNQGLSRFDPVNRTFQNYTESDGLQDNEFNSCAYFKSPAGELFFGGIGGFNTFFPEEIQNTDFTPPIQITNLLLANQKVTVGAAGSPLKKPVSKTKELVLSYRDKIFGFEFAALDFTDPKRNQYAYKLENFDDDWQYIGSQNNATFTNINPGTYTFKVKGTNYDGYWNEEGTSLKITILPPWWKTWWAYIIYVFIFSSVAFSFYRLQLHRQLERAEANRLKDLNLIKTRLYNNITHEFRTPLTIIMGMTDTIKGYEQERNLIRRNSENLLRLINQMLDLSKLEAGNLQINLVQGNIISYLEYLTESFFSMSQEKEVRLVFYSELKELIMDFDENKIQHIIYNLLSNALKFTDKGGKVVLHASEVGADGQSYLQLKVQDTGKGIAEDQVEHIFDRFYQADNSTTRKGEGTGIGLALTKELVELLEGNIKVESTLGKGTTFTLLLPVKRTENTTLSQPKMPVLSNGRISGSTPSIPDISEAVPEARSTDQPVLLLIEDNADVATYIQSILKHMYTIHFARNGQQGIDKAIELIPDLVISDVMMPEKDGYEVCASLKEDERTSHIPVILLTAKAAEADKISGLKMGADAYLIKPFNKEELFIRLENLLETRKKLQVKYAKSLLSEPEPISPPEVLSVEDLFLSKLRKVVIEQLDSPELGVEQLCQAVHLSQSQLYRKLKALTNETPNSFIRKIRVHRAQELLSTTDLNISEVAYAVGFNDPGYFSRSFHKEFGVSPSTFRK